MRLIALALAAVVISVLGAPASQASGKSATATSKSHAKSHVRTHHYRRTGRGAYFVPPPPPYMPSIIPELRGTAISEIEGLDAEEAPPENPYQKYFFSADGSDAPKPVEHRSGVSTWTTKPVSYTHRR